jgi:hypothetical protein
MVVLISFGAVAFLVVLIAFYLTLLLSWTNKLNDYTAGCIFIPSYF